MGNLDFLDSPNQLFRLSFFNFGDSAMNYLGIQCTIFTEAKIVWVANRENPLKDTPALHITPHGNLLLIGNHGTSITLHSQIRVAINTNTTATLLDIRNFILKAGDNDEILWQRFDYPSNTLFLGMQLGLFDIKSRQARNIALTSWLSPLIPTPGAFRLDIDNLKFKHISNEYVSYYTFTMVSDIYYSWIEMDSTAALDHWDIMDNHSLGLSDCQQICIKNGSCNAYATFHSDGTEVNFQITQNLMINLESMQIN
ncbi:hypothetical protein FEM48_Zijuj01G0202700 [Ziziphus jujuba var. spinosa]|uniref:Bulb-type lectin domain-containing protein n=1 Tax=Ziziphus jujuba var. spinosa TaxID=714518 RepID=A0A978W3C2_ZIZJJ|nr:hypothetical protein FEM48_Zijuj01G0202700 [Ziziphus jujuba var. spinosa]